MPYLPREMTITESQKKMREIALKANALAKSRGYKGGLLTREEREKIGDEFIKKYKIKLV